MASRACHLRTLLTALAGAALVAGAAASADFTVAATRADEAAPAAFDGRLRVATLNMWGVALPLGIDVADHIDARFRALGRRLEENGDHLDVVLLQEVWKDSARRALLEDPGVRAQFPFQLDVEGALGESGLAVLSRYPIAGRRARFHLFERCGAWWRIWEADCLGGKGIVMLRIEAGDAPVWIANTHTIACYPQGSATECDTFDPNGSYRWDQLLALRAFVSDLAGPAPVIIGGDFNFTRSSRYYAAVRHPERSAALQRGDDFADSLERHPPDRAWRDAREQGDPPERIDYLWVRPGDDRTWLSVSPAAPILTDEVELEDGSNVPLSDHPAIAATFCLAKPSESPPRCETSPGKAE